MVSECVLLRPDEILPPVGDSGPSGANLGFITKGRAKVQMDGEGGDNLMLLSAGSIVAEGILAEFGAHIKGDLPCQIFRLAKHAFEAAVASDPATQKWIWLLRMKEKETSDELRKRLTNNRGLRLNLVPHVRDREIIAWSANRKERLDMAATMAATDSLPKFRQSAVPLGFAPLQTDPHSSVRSERKNLARTVPFALRESGAGLRCYSAVRLPHIQQQRGLSLALHRSEPRLPGSRAHPIL